MKKRSLFLVLLALVLAFATYQAYVFYLDDNDNLQSIYLVPKDAVFVMETQEPIANWEKISESDIWKHLNKNDYFNTLTKSLNVIDTLFKQKQSVFDKIGNREILISAHVYSPKKYSFLYVVDLEKIAKLNLLKNNLNTLIGEKFKVSKRKYHTHEITEIYDIKEKETLYISFIKNQMIASYVHVLIEAAIDQYLEPEIGRDLNFIEVKKHVGYNDMFRLYFQYDYLQNYVNVFSNNSSDIVNKISSSLEFSGFSFNLVNNNIIANGITNTNTEANLYIKALQKSGKGSRTISAVAPQKTALYLSFAFSSFSDFYSNFETIYKEKPTLFKSYIDGTEQIENFLKIDLKKHFISWIDDEIALLQIHSNVSQSKKDIALVLKTKNKLEAKENLDFIVAQIKKRSPVKFEGINYKGYSIKFMSIKGFFKILLGDLFKEIDKPYYTIIDDYVVFSNHPNTLKSIINNYINNETLANFKPFNTLNTKFENRSSVFAYINTPNLYNSVYSFVDNTTKKQLTKNKDYVICFPQIGFQLTPESDYFESTIIMNYETPESVKNNYTFNDTAFTPELNKDKNTITKVIDNVITKDNINEATVFNIPEIFPTNLTAKEYTKNYPNGTIHFLVELKNGLKHGKYKEYYNNGVLKISGKYKKDEQVSSWKLYDLKENLVFKKRY